MAMDRRHFIGTLGSAAAIVGGPAVLRAQTAETFRLAALCPITGAGSPFGSGMQKMIWRPPRQSMRPAALPGGASTSCPKTPSPARRPACSPPRS